MKSVVLLSDVLWELFASWLERFSTQWSLIGPVIV